MIHEAYMPVYMGSRFLARDGRTEVVQEALADLKTISPFLSQMIYLYESTRIVQWIVVLVRPEA